MNGYIHCFISRRPLTDASVRSPPSGLPSPPLPRPTGEAARSWRSCVSSSTRHSSLRPTACFRHSKRWLSSFHNVYIVLADDDSISSSWGALAPPLPRPQGEAVCQQQSSCGRVSQHMARQKRETTHRRRMGRVYSASIGRSCAMAMQLARGIRSQLHEMRTGQSWHWECKTTRGRQVSICRPLEHVSSMSWSQNCTIAMQLSRDVRS
jgi:hypothetical protein